MDPPQLDTQPTFNRRLRFVQTNSGQKVIPLTSVDMFNALGFLVDFSTTAYPMAYTFKIKSIEIWASPKSDSDNSWQHASIDWHNSTSFASGKKVSDVSISNARPLHVYSKPPKDSVCNFWIQNTGVQYVTLDVPTGAIVDVVVSYTMADSTTHENVLVGLVDNSPQIYYGYLDTQAGTNCLRPTDLHYPSFT